MMHFGNVDKLNGMAVLLIVTFIELVYKGEEMED